MKSKLLLTSVGTALLGLGTLGLGATAMAASNTPVMHGTVTAVSGSTITLQGGKQEGNAVLTLDTSLSTKFFDVTRGGISGKRTKVHTAAATVKVGDTVTAYGTLTGGTTMNATKVLDVTGAGALHGKVTAINGSVITLTTDKKHGDTTYTVNVSSSTNLYDVTKPAMPYTKRVKTSTTLSTIKVGDALAVKGTLSTSVANTINATTILDLLGK